MKNSERVNKTEAEWRAELTPEQFHVMREKGTEKPYSGKYYKSDEKGIYRCASCGTPLFSSDTKFDSGSGWPSFSEPISSENIIQEVDKSLGMQRAEILCKLCGGHLGHVFDDGPTALPDGKPGTGKRFCINSVALDLDPREDKDQAL